MTIERKVGMGIAGQPSGGAANVADVFSTYLYTGNGSTQTINNGIDLAGEGGMVWIKDRTASKQHTLLTTDISLPSNSYYPINFLATNSSGAMQDIYGGGGTGPWASSFLSDGFSLYNNANYNTASDDYASWTFRKAPKFFDVVTYTGSGSARSIAHNLGAAPAFIMVKRTSSSAGWAVYHKDNGSAKYMLMDAGAALTETTEYTAAGDHWNGTTPSDTTFSLGGHYEVNYLNNEYVAYLFADNSAEDADDQMIKCGSYTGAGAHLNINLGWEPQFVLIKCTSHSANWVMFDNMRGLPVDGNAKDLRPNATDTEGDNSAIGITSTGFLARNGVDGQINANGRAYIYMAIRAPMMKEPSAGTEVFAVDNITSSTSQSTSTFPVDFAIATSGTHYAMSRLTGTNVMATNSTGAEFDWGGGRPEFDHMDGISLSANMNGYLVHMFKRAKGFFDVVAYSGNSVAGHQISHSLGVAPEMIWAKCRSTGGGAYYWQVYHSAVGDTHTMRLNEANTPAALSMFNNITTTSFKLDNWANTNESGETYIAYLFATIAGISKVGSYTGNGSSQTINCGFAAGARFILIKRTDTTGDWYVWDTARGIVAGNDPHISLNTTAAQVSDDSIDPDSSGFSVNQISATNINVSSGTYIYLAIA